MAKKASKKIIHEAVQAAIKGEVINELDVPGVAFAKSVGAGIKGGVQTVGGNYRANRAKSYMDQYAKKTQKDAEKFGNKALKQAQKMKTSKHPAVKQTGEKIEDEVADTKQRVQQVAQDINQSFPSSVGQEPITGMAARGDMKRGVPQAASGVLGGFYKWLADEHGMGREDFLALGKQAQFPYTEEYLKDVGAKKLSQKKEAELGAQLQQAVKQEPSAETGRTPPEGMEQMLKKYPQLASQPQVPSQTTQTQPMAQPPEMTQPQPQQKPQPQPQQKPGLTATIGDMVAQKPLRLTGTDVLGLPPEVAKRMPKKELERRKKAAKQQQAAPPPKQQAPFGKKIPTTTQAVLDLPSVGASPEEYALVNKAYEEGHPAARRLIKSMQWGDLSGAKKHLQTLRQTEFQHKTQKSTPKTKATKTAKKSGGEKTKALRKQRVEMPPQDQFKNIVGQSAQKYVPPSPDALKPGESPSQKKSEKQTKPVKVRVAAPEKDQERRVKQRKKNISGTEGDEPIMTMADFMKWSENDPDQVAQAKQKIDQERELLKPTKKKKSDTKLGKRVIKISDVDQAARIDDKFVSPKERKREGF